jgi:hypothetical protein
MKTYFTCGAYIKRCYKPIDNIFHKLNDINALINFKDEHFHHYNQVLKPLEI